MVWWPAYRGLTCHGVVVVVVMQYETNGQGESMREKKCGQPIVA